MLLWLVLFFVFLFSSVFNICRSCCASVFIDIIELSLVLFSQTATEWKDSYALWADCFVFVYSITEYSSFEELSRLRRLVESSRHSTTLTCALVGNKNDLVYDRQVTVTQGRNLAADMGARFYELSACDWNQLPQVCQLFTDLHASWRRARGIRDSRQRKSSSSAKFKQAIQKVISGKSSTLKRNSLTGLPS